MIQVLKQVTSLIIPKFIARKPKIKHGTYNKYGPLLLHFISTAYVLDVTISSMPVQIISRIIAVSADSMLIVQMFHGKRKFSLDMSERRNTVNKSKIEWCDHTWNPITGCNHGCHYCYAKNYDSQIQRRRKAQ